MARYDKYDPIANGFRCAVAADFLDVDLNRLIGVGLNSSGQMVRGDGQSGVIAVLVNTQKPGRTGPRKEIRVLDLMQQGCVTDFGPTEGIPGVDFGTAGTKYYSDSAGNISAASVATADVQTVSLGGATGGTWGLTVVTPTGSGKATGLAFNATTSAVQTALQALVNVGSGNLLVTGSAGAYVITGASADVAVELMDDAIDYSALTGYTSTPNVVHTTEGSAGGGTYVGVTVEPDRLQVSVVPKALP